MSRHDGLRGDRVQRSGPPEQDRDMQTEIEDEMQASGRSRYVPREGLVGAHEERSAGSGADPDAMQEPVGRGSEVAPTRKAEMREAARHDLERQMGHVAAGGDESVLRQRRGPHATREALDGIAAEVDELVARLRLNAEGEQARLIWRARDWLWERRTGVAVGAGAAVLAIGGLALLRRSR
jgi:hypothetical protein